MVFFGERFNILLLKYLCFLGTVFGLFIGGFRR
jgi:hypothetical protein